ncbi:MAG: TonB family protein [Bacteroidia bacterium]|jgi:protein TonB
METNHTNAENLNDMVFENRNKAYGAYAIRNAYSDNVSKALFIMLLLSGTLVLITFLFANSKTDIIKNMAEQIPIKETFTMKVDLTPKEEPKPPVEQKQQPKDNTPKSDNTAYQASNNEKDVSTVTNENAVTNPEGTPNGNDSAFSEPKEPTGQFIGIEKNDSNTPIAIPDVFPEFNGNLLKYLSNKIHYPYLAIDNGTSGTVNLQFVVEKDGSINDIKVLHSIPDGCTEEAIRVVKSMPKWKPGRNAGEPVRVLFNLPVKFTLK